MSEIVKKEIKKLELDITQVTRVKSLFNENQIQKIWNSTPKNFQYKRPAKGGGEWTYIKASYVRKVLDSVFGFNWSFNIETTLGEAFEIAKMTKMCVVKGTLTGRVKNDGQWIEISKTQFGRSEVKFLTEYIDGKKTIKLDEFTGAPVPMDFGNDMKAATSDCLKKCASLFGIGADIYEPDEFMAIELIGSDESSERAKNTKKRLAGMKKLKAEEVK